MLQNEKGAFEDFNWYDNWREQAKTDPVLKWLHDARTDVVHRQALEPRSWLEMVCLDNPPVQVGEDDESAEPIRFRVNPFECTHYYMARGPLTDHAHRFTRHWSMEGLDEAELLDACADAYDRLEALIDGAHARLGRRLAEYREPSGRRALPCMEDTTKHRIVETVVVDGIERWENEPPALHPPD